MERHSGGRQDFLSPSESARTDDVGGSDPEAFGRCTEVSSSLQLCPVLRVPLDREAHSLRRWFVGRAGHCPIPCYTGGEGDLQLTYTNLHITYTLSSVPFPTALQRWLVEALKGKDGRERNHESVFEAADVSQGTFYKILRGRGGGVRQGHVTALARTLGAPVPMLDRVLRLPGDPLYRVEATEPPAATDPMKEAELRDRSGAHAPKKPRRRKAG